MKEIQETMLLTKNFLFVNDVYPAVTKLRVSSDLFAYILVMFTAFSAAFYKC